MSLLHFIVNDHSLISSNILCRASVHPPRIGKRERNVSWPSKQSALLAAWSPGAFCLHPVVLSSARCWMPFKELTVSTRHSSALDKRVLCSGSLQVLYTPQSRVHEMHIPGVYMALSTLSSRPFSGFLAKDGVAPYWNLSQKEISNTEPIFTKIFDILFIMGHSY